ncbi:hypothetical protein ASF71_10010 [Deinococcus sp. Leaf326]|nr:hypothetical protein ASF71_10010 [Deinococcus sp. Leaf326]
MATSYQNGLKKIQATTGASAEEAKKYGEIVKNVYGKGLGDSLEDVASSVANVAQQFKGLSSKEIQQITEDAHTLKNAFGIEINDSIGSVNTLMKSFGITSKEAFDLVAYGMQSGLDQGGDFIDTIQEYGTQFKEAGFSAQEFYSIIATGAQNGSTLGTDKVADLIKEFGLRIADGSKATSTALKDLGLNADEVAKKLGSGEWTKGQVFAEIQTRLQGVTNAAERQNIGVALLGTQYEDMGQKAVAAIKTNIDKQAEMSQAMEKARAVNQGLSQTFQASWRQIQVALIPVGEMLLALAGKALPYVTEAVKVVVGWITQLTASFKQTSSEGGNEVKKLMPLFNSIREAVTTAVRAIVDIWNKLLIPLFTALAPAAKAAFGVVGGYLQIFAGFIKAVFGSISLILKGDWGGAWEFFKTTLANSLKTADTFLNNLSAGFVKQLGAIVTNIKIWGTNLAAEFSASIANAFNRAKTKAAEGVNNILDGMGLGKRISIPVAVEVAPQKQSYVKVPNMFTGVGNTPPVNTAPAPRPAAVATPQYKTPAAPAPTPTPSRANVPLNPTQAPAAEVVKVKKGKAVSSDAPAVPKWDDKDSQKLKRLVDDLQHADKTGKATADSIRTFNQALQDLGNKATEAGVRNNSVVSSLITEGKEASRTAAQHVQAQTARKAADKAAKDAATAYRAELSNLKSAVKDMTATELERRIGQEKAKPQVDQKRLEILLAAQATKQLKEQKEAQRQLTEAQKANSEAAVSAARTARDNILKDRETNLNASLDSALKAAGDDLQAQLKVYAEYKPKFVALAHDRNVAIRDDALAEENKKYGSLMTAAKKAGADTTQLTRSHNALLSSINQTYRTSEAQASKTFADKVADVRAKVEEQALKDRTKAANTEFDNATKSQVAKLSSMSNEQLSTFKTQIEGMRPKYLELGKAGQDVVTKIDEISGKVTESIQANVDKAKSYFADLLEDGKGVQEQINAINSGLSTEKATGEKYASDKLKPVTNALSSLGETLKKAKENFLNLIPGTKEYGEAKTFIDGLETVIKTSNANLLTAQARYVSEWNRTEADRQDNNKLQVAKNNLELGLITKAQYASQLDESKKYWEGRLAQEESGSDDFISVQSKLVSLSGEITKGLTEDVKDSIDALKLDKLVKPEDFDKAGEALEGLKKKYKDFPELIELVTDALNNLNEKQGKLTTDTGKAAVGRLDLGDPEQLEKNISALDALEIKYKDFPEVLDAISKAYESIGATVEKVTTDADKATEDFLKTVDDGAESLGKFSEDVGKFRESLSSLEGSGKRDDAQLVLDGLTAQRDALTQTAKTEEEKAQITLDWAERVRLAKLAVAQAELEIALASNEAARTQALNSDEAIGQAERINAIYDAQASRIKTQNTLTVNNINSTSKVETDAATKTLENNQKMMDSINKYSGYAKTGIGLIVGGLQALGGMSEEVASQWGADLGSMVDDITNLATSIAKGDWIGAAVQGLMSIFNWINRNAKAAQDARKATEDYGKQFKFVSGDQFRSVETYSTGFLFWQTTHYKETLDELGVEITKTLDSGIGQGVSSGIQNYLNGTGGVAEAINASLKGAIVNAITQAVIESAIIKEKLGPLLAELAAGIRNSTDVSGVLARIKTTIPEVASTLEATLSPIKSVLNEIFPAADKVADTAERVIDSFAEFVKTLAEGIKSGVEGGFKTGIQKFLEGGTVEDMFEGIKAGIKSSIVNAVLEAVMNGAIIQGSLGPMLKHLTEALASGTDPSAIIASIASALPTIVSTLEQTLAPIRSALEVLNPNVVAPVPAAPSLGVENNSGSSSNGVTTGVSTSNTVNNDVKLTFYITEASDSDKIARDVERRLTKTIMGYA